MNYQEILCIGNQILKDRFKTVLPDIMRRNNIDMWIIIAREYNEDPVVKTLLPPTWLHARRRTILVFSKTKEGIDPVAITRYNFGNNIRSIWNKEKEPNQWKALADYIVSQNPKKIGINYIYKSFIMEENIAKLENVRV